MYRTVRALIVGLLATLASGCYRYGDVTADALRPGARVRARISAAEAEQLAQQLGSVRRVLEGEVVAADASAVTVAVQADIQPGSMGSALRQRVALAPASILEVQVRELDRARTVGAVAAGAALVAVAALAIEGGVFGGGNEKPINEANRIPIIRVPLPR